MAVYAGASKVTGLHYGGHKIAQAYLGDVLVYEDAPMFPVHLLAIGDSRLDGYSPGPGEGVTDWGDSVPIQALRIFSDGVSSRGFVPCRPNLPSQYEYTLASVNSPGWANDMDTTGVSGSQWMDRLQFQSSLEVTWPIPGDPPTVHAVTYSANEYKIDGRWDGSWRVSDTFNKEALNLYGGASDGSDASFRHTNYGYSLLGIVEDRDGDYVPWNLAVQGQDAAAVIDNAGKPGMYRIIEQDFTHALIALGANDAITEVSLGTFEGRMELIAGHIRSLNPGIKLLGLTSPYLVGAPVGESGWHEYNDVLRDVCDDVVDVAQVFTYNTEAHAAGWIGSDLMHWTPLGATEVSRMVADTLRAVGPA